MVLFQIIEVRHHPGERVEYQGDGAPSKEEEERYQKLMRENEDMQRLIAEVRVCVCVCVCYTLLTPCLCGVAGSGCVQ